MTEQRFLTVDDILSWKVATQLSVGPGPKVAYTLREADVEKSAYRSHIWSVTPGGEPAQLTRGPKNCSQALWSPDGRYLAFLSNRPDEKADDEPQTQVWLLPAAGGEAFCLTRAVHGIRSYQWSEDATAICYVAEEPDLEATKARRAREKKQKLDAVVEHADRRRRQVWQVEAKSGAEARLLHDGDFGLDAIALSPDGKRVAFTTNYTGYTDEGQKTDLWVLDVESGQTRQLTRGTGGVYGLQWSPDGSRVSYLAPHDPRYTFSRTELYAVPAAGGEPVHLCPESSEFRGDVEGYAWLGGTELLIQAAEGCGDPLYRFDLTTGRLTRLTGEGENVNALALSADRRYVAYLAEGAEAVPDVKLLDLAPGESAAARGESAAARGGAPVTLTDLNPVLRTEIRLAPQEIIRWQAQDGLTIEGVLTLPPDHQPGQSHPLLVYVHGGPHSSTRNNLRQYVNFQVMAAQGYAVLAPNYRGGSSYGHEFAVANRNDLGGSDFQDIMAGVDHVIALGVADPDRMGILGGSYGGYMTNWAIGQTDRFKAAVSMFGIFSLITDYSQSKWPGWETGYLGDYWFENLEPYTRCAPATYVKNMTTPVLIIHGDADDNTFPANSKEMYQALRHLGRTVEYVHYPREGHGLQEPNHKKDEYRRTLAWFERHILGRIADEDGTVEKDGHAMTVTGVACAESYSGRKAKGRFAAIRLDLAPGGAGAAPTGATAPKTLKLDLSLLRLVADEGGLRWEAGVAGTPAGNLLVPSTGTVETNEAASLTLLFDLPAKAPKGGWRLDSGFFPAVNVDLA